MNDSPKSPRDEMEARLTALLLGELPDAEAAALRRELAADPELARLHARLAQTIVLVRETTAAPTGDLADQPAPLRLSDARREKLLAHFKTAPMPVAAKRKSRAAPSGAPVDCADEPRGGTGRLDRLRRIVPPATCPAGQIRRHPARLTSLGLVR